MMRGDRKEGGKQAKNREEKKCLSAEIKLILTIVY